LQRILRAALQIQGGFSNIADISATYVHVSSVYIRPTINEMEQLANDYQRDEGWRNRWDVFVESCKRKAGQITSTVTKSSDMMRVNMKKQVERLTDRAIEAEAEAEEEAAAEAEAEGYE
jgi:hypothetical protein